MWLKVQDGWCEAHRCVETGENEAIVFFFLFKRVMKVGGRCVGLYGQCFWHNFFFFFPSVFVTDPEHMWVLSPPGVAYRKHTPSASRQLSFWILCRRRTFFKLEPLINVIQIVFLSLIPLPPLHAFALRQAE